jgi:hypothetical protein
MLQHSVVYDQVERLLYINQEQDMNKGKDTVVINTLSHY